MTLSCSLSGGTVAARAMAGEDDVHIVGGANSAGQAALHLAKFASQVTLLIRGGSLAPGMSDYLIARLNATPTSRSGPAPDRRRPRRHPPASAAPEDLDSRRQERVPTPVFIMTGAQSRTGRIRDAPALDDHGLILTGRELPAGNCSLSSATLPFETSLRGVIAAGEVRHGSIKRAAVVGEGSVSVGFGAPVPCHNRTGQRPVTLQKQKQGLTGPRNGLTGPHINGFRSRLANEPPNSQTRA